MELALRLRRELPREIIPDAFFLINAPRREDFLLACRMGHSNLIEILLSIRGQWVRMGDDMPICLAARSGNVRSVSLLLERKADAAARRNVPICMTSGRGNLEIVSLLLERKADAGARRNEPICSSSLIGNPDIVSLLLEGRADASARADLPLVNAAMNNHTSVVAILLENGASPCGTEAFMWAASHGNSEMCSLLIAHGAPPET